MREITVFAQQQSQGYIIQSPAVGYISQLSLPGQVLNSESSIGTITILSTSYTLKLPPNIGGQVAHYDTELKIRPLGYGDPIFAIIPLQDNNLKLATSELGTETICCQGGRWIVRAITDGIFYRRPSPDSPAYIDVGQEVNKGQVLGLVEVMKCFNKITFDGNDFPATAKVAEICVKDGSEVKYNQPLFVFA